MESWTTEERPPVTTETPTPEPTIEAANETNHSLHYGYIPGDDIITYPGVQAIFYLVYLTIFGLGIFGNVLVCFVVGRNKAMQTVTNFFITNLALADILLCALAVPFTPLYTFLQEWIFGRVLCHLVAYAQGTSVYISTLTLTSIAIDRFFVIIYPFKPRMLLTTCLLIIAGIWAFALLATLPYGIFLDYQYMDDKFACVEDWPSNQTQQVFSASTVVLQFILPFIIILFCYIKVSIKLSDRARAKPGSKNSKKEAIERERKRRTNRMLIAMVFIFGVSWLPLNVVNFISDVYADIGDWRYSTFCFFIAHAVAMSSTCYNPFLYAWLNENFRKEFKQVLPCFHAGAQGNVNRSKRFVSQRNCNGGDTVQESLMPTTSQAVTTTTATHTTTAPPCNTTVVQVMETIEELNSTSQGAPMVCVDLNRGSASFIADPDEVIVHYQSFTKNNKNSSNAKNSSPPSDDVETVTVTTLTTTATISGGNKASPTNDTDEGQAKESTGNNTFAGNKSTTVSSSGSQKRKSGGAADKDSREALKIDAVVHSFDEESYTSPDMINLETFACDSVLI